MGRDDDDTRSGKRYFVWFLCFLAVWLLIAGIILVVRHGWSFPDMG